jgi:hypothetical protein
MLAVIQHQQQLPTGQHPRQHPGHRDARLLPHSQRRRHDRRDQRRVLHRRQLGQPRPVREPARHSPGHLTGQPGLARAARPGHRHQPVLLQQPGCLAHGPGPADKTGQDSRETMDATSRDDRRRRYPHARTITTSPGRRTAQPHQPASPNVKRTAMPGQPGHSHTGQAALPSRPQHDYPDAWRR